MINYVIHDEDLTTKPKYADKLSYIATGQFDVMINCVIHDVACKLSWVKRQTIIKYDLDTCPPDKLWPF